MERFIPWVLEYCEDDWLAWLFFWLIILPLLVVKVFRDCGKLLKRPIQPAITRWRQIDERFYF